MESRVAAAAIRHGTRADLAAVVALENAVFAIDRLSRRSISYFLHTPTAVVFLAESRQGLEGYALLAFRKNSKIARIYSLAVATRALGRGLGRALIAAGEAEARRRGVTRVRLEVRPDNFAAIALYASLDYREFGRYEDYYEDDTAALRLEKLLPL